MNWINFAGGKYTFAADIQQFAEMNGYKPPCEADGTRHPGTDCNAKMRTIFKDAGMRHTFKVTINSVLEVRAEDTTFNSIWIHKLVKYGVISEAYLKHKSIQLYSEQAVNALLSVMLKTQVEYQHDENDKEWYCEAPITAGTHNLEKKRNKPKASLFKK